MPGVIFKSIKQKTEQSGKKWFTLTVDFICESFKEAEALKEKFEKRLI